MSNSDNLDQMAAKAYQNGKKPRRSWLTTILAVVGVLALVVLAVIFVPPMLNTLNARASEQTAPAGANTSPNTDLSAPTQAVVPTVTTPFVWDGTFPGAAEFYIDGDLNVTGWKVQGSEMSYTCTENFGVYITMDPGSVQTVSTGKFGAVAFVPCVKGSMIKFTTSFWSDSALHQQTHLVEVVKQLPDSLNYRDLLISLQTAEKKPIALFFKADGTCETINSNSANPTNPAPSNSASASVPFVWDGKFSGAAEFYIDGDPNVTGWKVQGSEMSYVCTKSFGVFITMDPGSVQTVSTGKFGAVAFIPCSEGNVVKLNTSSWSTSALHQQIHLVEIVKQLPDTLNYRDLLLSLKTADGKPIALFFKADGTYETIK